MSVAVLTSLEFGNSRRVIGLPAAIAAGQPVTYEQYTAGVQASIEGLGWQDNVRVDATSNINLASPGASVNGIAMNLGNRFLPRAQTAGAENEI